MQIILVGLNHRTAPVALREQLALADCSLRMALEDLTVQQQPRTNGFKVARPRLTESVILSTCNRLEIYSVTNGEPAAGWRQLEGFLSGLQGIPVAELQPHLYYQSGSTAVSHLMAVAAGLDSMILGEPQILGQVTTAHAEAQIAGGSGPILSHLFDLATHAGKRARTETEIGRHTTSISHAAAQLIAERVQSIETSQVLIFGAGEMALLAAQALQARGARQLSFINRTYARAESLAQIHAGQAVSWYHLPAALAAADVVVTATGAPHIVLHEENVRPILAERGGRPLLIVDIAVPRDVEETVGNLPGVERVDIDQLQSTIEANLAQRQAAIPEVRAIIAEEAERFEQWLQGRQVLPVLVELRQKTKEIANAELAAQLSQLDDLSPECQAKVARIVHRVVNKMLHEPTVRLKASAAEGNGVEYAQALRDLFALEGPTVQTDPIFKSPANNGHYAGKPAQPTE